MTREQPGGFGDRVRLTGYAAEQVLWFPVLIVGFVLTATGGALCLIVVGLPVVDAGMRLNRFVADRHRRMAGRVAGTELLEQHRPLPDRGWLRRLRVRAEDPMTWRELGWTVVAATAGLFVSLLTVLLFVTGVAGVLWWYAVPPLLGLRSALDRWLLCYGQAERMQTRIVQLQATRAELADHSAAELRRLERDLHDGPQARLVALSMTLGMADSVYDEDPEQARRLMNEARASTQAVLGDLRSVVRGIHPPVLADRGLGGAVEALALDMAFPVDTQNELAGRPPAPVETAVYFAIAESLANSGKYAQAQHAWVTLEHDRRRLRAVIGDDGIGGADPDAGTGLRGVATRLAAFDGTMWVSSPAGGPTLITLEVPCVLSSPRTSPSSGPA